MLHYKFFFIHITTYYFIDMLMMMYNLTQPRLSFVYVMLINIKTYFVLIEIIYYMSVCNSKGDLRYNSLS